MSLVAKQWQFLQEVCKLIDFVREQGWIVTGGELWRPPFTQQYYVKIGRSKTYNSQHLKRLAIDLNFFKPVDCEKYAGTKGLVRIGDKCYLLTWKVEDIKPFGEFWESLSPDNRWGGHFKTFKDVDHFEKRG